MNKYQIEGELWSYNGPAAWCFITVPNDISADIKRLFGEMSPGFGSIAVDVTLGKTTWKTSIFYDTKESAYLLPIKGVIRKKEKIVLGEQLKLEITVIL